MSLICMIRDFTIVIVVFLVVGIVSILLLLLMLLVVIVLVQVHFIHEWVLLLRSNGVLVRVVGYLA